MFVRKANLAWRDEGCSLPPPASGKKDYLLCLKRLFLAMRYAGTCDSQTGISHKNCNRRVMQRGLRRFAIIFVNIWKYYYFFQFMRNFIVARRAGILCGWFMATIQTPCACACGRSSVPFAPCRLAYSEIRRCIRCQKPVVRGRTGQIRWLASAGCGRSRR